MIENLSGKKVKKRGLQVLSKKDEIVALQKLKNPLAKNFVIFICQTGLRISEALAVEVSDIENGHVVLRQKRDRIRTTYFNPTLREQMLRYIHERNLRANQNPDLLFPVTRQALNWHLKKVGIYPHQLRHTFLTRALRKSKNLKMVQELAGHQNINTTSMYLHFTETEIEEQYHKLVNPFSRLFSYLKFKIFRKKLTLTRVPERKFSPDPIHKKFVIYGEKGVGKSHMIRNTWPELTEIRWDSKGQTNRSVKLAKKDGQNKFWIFYDNPTPTKLKHAEDLDDFLVAEFRLVGPTDLKKIDSRLFEFQPFSVEPFSLAEARHYLKFLCRSSSAQFSKVKNLLEISTNPLFLKENLFRKRKEILMSSPPVTFGALFMILGLVFMLSRYVAMGRETYFFAMGGYFIFRIFARL